MKMQYLLCDVGILYDLISFDRKQNEGSGDKVGAVWIN